MTKLNKTCSVLTVVFYLLVMPLSAQINSDSTIKKSLTIFFPWIEGLEPRTEFSGRYALQMYQVIPEKNELCLLSDDSRLVIYDLRQPEKPKESIQLEGQIERFYYEDGYYYCLRHADILRVDSGSRDISLVMEFERPGDFYLQNYYVESGDHYFLTADERTFILKNGTIELLGETAMRYKGDYNVYAEIKPGNGFELSMPAGYIPSFTGCLPGQRSKSVLLTSVPVGSTKEKVYLDSELDMGDNIPTRVLYTLNHSGEIQAHDTIPFMYYIELQSPWCVVDNSIYYILTTQDGFYLVKDCDFTNVHITTPYHYNNSLPVNPYEGEEMQNQDIQGRQYGSNCVTRTQAVARAKTYEDMQWTASTPNWVNNCTTIPGGTTKYRTPLAYSNNGAKTSIPYKWGGFTKWTDWLGFVSSGKKTGNYFTSNNSTCSGTAYSSDLDTYVIGVDCSGAVTRWWEYYPKQSTNSLPDISTYLGLSNTQAGFSALKKGDIVNKAGSHTRMCIDDNPTGTATFMEASGGNWNVQHKSYSYTELTGYKSYRYNNIIDSRLKLAQAITLSPSTVNKNCPLTVTYKIKNEGTESWTGKVLLVLIQSNGVEAGIDGPYTITLGPNQTSSLFTYNSPAFNYPTGSSKIEVRVKNNSSSCNYGLYYAVESGSYQNPKSFVIYNNCNSAADSSDYVTVNESKILTVRIENDLPATIHLYDITGREIANFECETTTCEYTLGSLPAGFFIASIIQNGQLIGTERVFLHE